MPDGFGVRRLTINLQQAGVAAAADICVLRSQVCIGPTLRLTPRCCMRWLSPCWRYISPDPCRLWLSPDPCRLYLSPDPCGPISPYVGCGPGSPVIDPRGVLTDPVIDFASLKAELQAALAQAEAMEKAEAEGLVPKTQDEIKSALGDLDYAQRQIEAARAELQDRLKGGGSKGS